MLAMIVRVNSNLLNTVTCHVMLAHAVLGALYSYCHLYGFPRRLSSGILALWHVFPVLDRSCFLTLPCVLPLLVYAFTWRQADRFVSTMDFR